MAYASFTDVQARLGRFQGIFEVSGKHPDQSDVEDLLDSVAGDIDAAIRSRGFDPAAMNASAKAALVDLNAYGALARALPATHLGRQAADLLATAAAVWDSAMGERGTFAAGTHPAIAELEAGQGGGPGPSAGDLWSDDPTYGSERGLAAEDSELEDTNLAPAFRRGQTF